MHIHDTLFPILFGTESEFAVTALDRDSCVLPVANITAHLLQRAAVRPHLLGAESGIFLMNGGRFYLDAGHHPEYAAPETTNPWDAVRYALAGDRLVSLLAHEVSGENAQIANLVLRKGNIDYASRTTWGSHENYLHRRPPGELRAALVPHLISRIVFTGSGGFDPGVSTHPRFLLSPRASFVKLAVGTSAPGEFALVDDRVQPHCTGYHRQHVICGDANQSHLAMLLRIGTTALVVALIDAGLDEADSVSLADPLAALAVVMADVSLDRPFDLACGGQITALQVQRHYLRQARVHRDRLPDWSGALCDLWQETLNRLEQGPEAVADRLDWAIKLAVFRDHAHRRAMPWPDAERSDADDRGRATSEQWRAELCELDLRFGQIDESSLFVALDEEGVLCHRIVTSEQIDRALDVPPSVGRAWIRGQVVTRLADRGDGTTCTWDAVHDPSGMMRLDLSDPFATSEVWILVEESADVLLSRLGRLLTAPPTATITQSIRRLVDRLGKPRGNAPRQRTQAHAVQLNNHAFELRNTGRFAEAEWLMRAALEIDLSARHDQHPKVLHRRNNLGVVVLLQGRLAEARELVTDAWPRDSGQHDLTTARVLTTRMLIAMLDGEPSSLYVGQLKAHLGIWPLPDLANVDSQWQMALVLKRLEHRLEPDARDLLLAIVDVLNGAAPLEALRALPHWRDTPLEPLSTPWPAPGSRSISSTGVSRPTHLRDLVE